MPGAGHTDHVPAHRALRLQGWRRTTVHHIGMALRSRQTDTTFSRRGYTSTVSKAYHGATNVILFLKLYRMAFLFFLWCSVPRILTHGIDSCTYTTGCRTSQSSPGLSLRCHNLPTPIGCGSYLSILRSLVFLRMLSKLNT